MNQQQAQERAASLYGNVQLERQLDFVPSTASENPRWCLIHVWDTEQRTYVLRGFGHTWEDAFIDAARYETAEIAYA